MRSIWKVTGLVVLIALVVVGVRQLRAMRHDSGGNSAVEQDVERLFTLLEEDPRVVRDDTRAALDKTASYAESGQAVTAGTLYALGLRAYHAYDLDASETAYRRAADMRGDWSKPYTGLAILLRITGRLPEAEAVARKAVRLAPDSMPAHNCLGNVLVVRGELEEAEDSYLRAIELRPNQPTPRYNLACVYSLEGRLDAALTSLQSAIELDDAFRDTALKDPDLDNLRDLPEFQALMEASADGGE